MVYNTDIPYNDLPNLPPVTFTESNELLRHLAKASRYLGELNGLCESLPDPSLLINTIVLQESKDSLPLRILLPLKMSYTRLRRRKDPQIMQPRRF